MGMETTAGTLALGEQDSVALYCRTEWKGPLKLAQDQHPTLLLWTISLLQVASVRVFGSNISLGITCIVLGKTNMTILNSLYGRKGAETPSNWSPRGGYTRSAYGRHLPPYGSSTGAGVALTAGFCAASVGCETDGSLVSLFLCQTKPSKCLPLIHCLLYQINPAKAAGLYALKPTPGTVPGNGIISVRSVEVYT